MHQQEEELAVVLARCTTPEQVREQGRRATASLRAAFEQLRHLSPDERRSAGQELNRTKKALEQLVDIRLQALAAEQPVTATRLSPTLPVPPAPVGKVHPTVAVMRRMHAFFTALGFTVADGPEIESDWYNFSALNLAPEHPAREMHDTIYLSEPSLLLRTHTSAVEIRAMEATRPPLRVIVPGKAYRAESVNATNNHVFYQYEVLAVDRGLSMAHLCATIDAFLHYLFGAAVRTRLRAKYYPQVEPGLGVDLECRFCRGEGCVVCKGKGWIEILGGGMVHPNTLAAVGLDWREHSGFALGLGLDRLVMSTAGIADIRQLYGPRMAYIGEV
jgi:phenylalanyl-tRNA synthetase alpha chain